MKFILAFTPTAKNELKKLKRDAGLQKRLKAVQKALKFLSVNPKHKSLQMHKYYSIKGPNGEEVFELYAEDKTPAAYRIFFYYGPQKRTLTVFAITPHP